MKPAKKLSDSDVNVSTERKKNPNLISVINETKQGSIFQPTTRNRLITANSENHHSNPRKRSSIKVMPKNTITPAEKIKILSENEEEVKSLRKSPSPFRSSIDEEGNKVDIRDTFDNKPQMFVRLKNQIDGSRYVVNLIVCSSSSDPDTLLCKCVFDSKNNTISNDFLEMYKSTKPCSKFCKYLAPEEEKRAILKATSDIDEFSDSQASDDEKFVVPTLWWYMW